MGHDGSHRQITAERLCCFRLGTLSLEFDLFHAVSDPKEGQQGETMNGIEWILVKLTETES